MMDRRLRNVYITVRTWREGTVKKKEKNGIDEILVIPVVENCFEIEPTEQ